MWNFEKYTFISNRNHQCKKITIKNCLQHRELNQRKWYNLLRFHLHVQYSITNLQLYNIKLLQQCTTLNWAFIFQPFIQTSSHFKSILPQCTSINSKTVLYGNNKREHVLPNLVNTCNNDSGFYTDLSVVYDKHVHDSVSIAVLKIRVSSLGDEEAHTFLLPQTGSEGQRVLPQVHVPLKTLYWYTGASDIHVLKRHIDIHCTVNYMMMIDMMVSYWTLNCPLN